MKLVTFDDGSGSRPGELRGDSVADLVAADPGLPGELVHIVRGGHRIMARCRSAAETAPTIPLTEVRLLAPIPEPRGNVIAVGRNYRDHAREFSESGFDASEKASVPPHPVIFTKAAGSVIGPGEPIRAANDPTGSTDYEGELGVVIGRDARSVSAEEALEYVFGYTIINDVTARELQSRHVQWFVGKSPDTFCPMGPCLVTRDEMPDLGTARLQTTVNGEVRQSFRLSDMIFDIPALLVTLSQVMTLRAGDVIATGTGSGVGIGFDPPRFLVPGDQVVIEVEGLGALSNPVV